MGYTMAWIGVNIEKLLLITRVRYGLNRGKYRETTSVNNIIGHV